MARSFRLSPGEFISWITFCYQRHSDLGHQELSSRSIYALTMRTAYALTNSGGNHNLSETDKL